jgi:hypothetical protein
LEFSNIVNENEVSAALQFLLMDSIIYLLLALYLNIVLPKEFGLRKPWHFPISDLFKRCSKAEKGLVSDLA